MTIGARRERRDVDGIALLDKPLGLSSNQALQRIRHLYGARRAGHTGSLDPLASGMLPICLGQATKVSAFLLDADKTYRFRVRFGVKTATGDLEGEAVATGPDQVTEAALRAAVASLVGASTQVPPMYSALKHEGQRLYELARSGRTVERPVREIRVATFDVVEFDPSAPVLLARCSKGTYIRTLAEDLAARLGTVGHLTALRRLSVAAFGEAEQSDMVAFERAAAAGQEALDAMLVPMDRALGHHPAVTLSAAEADRIRHGQAVPRPGLPIEGLARLYDAAGCFLGMGEMLADGRLVPRRLLADRPAPAPKHSGL